MAGIDTTIFKPHSIRSAASSAAFNAELHYLIFLKQLTGQMSQLSPDFIKEQQLMIILLKRFYQSMYTALKVKVGEAWRGT